MLLNSCLNSVSLLRTALQQNPQNFEAALLLSEALRSAGDITGARAIITPLAAANPQHFGAQRQLGVILAANAAPVPSSIALRAAADLNPVHPTIWRDLADQLALAGDIIGSQTAYARHAASQAMDPALAPAAERLRAGDHAGAETLLQSHLGRLPTDVLALRMLSEAQARAGASIEAEQTMRRIIALAPRFQPTRHDGPTIYLLCCPTSTHELTTCACQSPCSYPPFIACSRAGACRSAKGCSARRDRIRVAARWTSGD